MGRTAFAFFDSIRFCFWPALREVQKLDFFLGAAASVNRQIGYHDPSTMPVQRPTPTVRRRIPKKLCKVPLKLYNNK